MFLASLYIKKTCKNCMISVFYQFADHSSSRPSGDLNFSPHDSFPWLLSLKSCWLKSKFLLARADRDIWGIPLLIGNVNSCRFESQGMCQRRRSHSTLRPGPGNAMVRRVMEKRKPGIFREKAKREGGLEKASVRGSEPLQIEKLSQQKQSPLRRCISSFLLLHQGKAWQWCFLGDISAGDSKAKSEIRLCLHFILEITQSSAPLCHQYSPFL